MARRRQNDRDELRDVSLPLERRSSDYYDTVLASAVAESRVLRGRGDRLSTARLLVAAAAVLAVIRATQIPTAIWVVIAVASVVLFIALVWQYARVGRRLGAATRLERACRAGLARIARDWDNVPPLRTPRLSDAAVIIAHDLDVVGRASLIRLLDIGNPVLGGARLAEWIFDDPADIEALRARQRSVAQLRAQPKALIDVAIVGRAARDRPADLASLTTWSTSPIGTQLLPGVARALVVVLVLTASAFAVQAARPVATSMVTLLIAAQLVLSGVARRSLNRELGGLDEPLRHIQSALGSARVFVDLPDIDGRMGDVQRRLREDGAIAAMDALSRLLSWNDVRYSPLAHWVYNAAIGFDVHLAGAVARWRARYGAMVPLWLDLVADGEALTALATLAFENPEWGMPELRDGSAGPLVDAPAIRHPLLLPAAAVPNPATIDKPGRVVIASGSNMSGKTTYVRAVGLNALLGLAGGPMAAARATLSRVRVRTSVRIEDDLTRGVSLFLAEVTRLRDVIHDARTPASPPVLFLLDEILQGTNARDRREATRVVLGELADAGAAGLVTTHDAEIATGLGQALVEQVHFQEAVAKDASGVRMTFDYALRPGPAHTANAQLILAMLGIGSPPPAAPRTL